MSTCDLFDSCFFFNEQLVDMPQTTEYLKEKYCRRDYRTCARYMINRAYGRDRVPRYLFPNDMIEVLNTDLAETRNLPGRRAMMVKVMYPDGTTDAVVSSAVDDLLTSGGIVAYRCSEVWIEVRRKRNSDYRGEERRVRRL